MAQQRKNEFNVWEYGAPFVVISSDGDFNNWQWNAPVEDKDESFTSQQVVTTTRRRVQIF